MANDSIAAILRDAESARWSLERVTAGLVDLDFDKPFLPEVLVHGEQLSFLTASERVQLSQIRAHGYLGLCVLGEKLALPFVMAQASWCLERNTDRFLALMGCGHRAAKHVAAFERFSAAVERGLDTMCEVVGPAEDLTARFLAHDTLALGVLALHCACLTQTHYVRAARGCKDMDARFNALFRHHWMEEAQNVRLQQLILAELCEQATPADRERALDQYRHMLEQLSASFATQVELDRVAFECVARSLDADERRLWAEEQSRSYHQVFVGHGVAHPALRDVIGVHFGGSLDELDDTTRYTAARPNAQP